MNFPFLLRISTLLLLWAGVCASAKAVTCSSSSGGPAVIDISMPSTVQLNTDLPVGSVLYSVDFWAKPAYEVAIRCNTLFNVKTSYAMTVGSLGSDGITYSSGVAGLGMRLLLPNTAGTTLYVPVESTNKPNFSPGTSAYGQFQLVKTGNITGGRTLSGQIAHGYVADGGFVFSSYRLSSAVTITPKKPTCAIAPDSKLTTVPLGSVSRSDFTGVGSTAGTQPFEINLKCANGATGTSLQVFAVLTDRTDTNNRSNVLSLTASSSARGVGLQLLKGSTVLSYGPDSTAANAANRWSAGSTGNGMFTIPLSARYVQTASEIETGSADAKATITFSYL